MPEPVVNRRQWTRLLVGLAAVFLLFQWSAQVLGSDRGQAGLLIAAIVIAASLTAERLLFGTALIPALRVLGLGRPSGIGLAVAAGVALVLFGLVAVFSQVTGQAVTFDPQTVGRMAPGLFAQAGIAEETLFRGYLFGHVRHGRRFWPAAVLSTMPFAAVHLLMFLTMPWPVALAALFLSIVISIPLAHLFELGGRTVWAPALLHAVVQGTVKVVVVEGDGTSFPLVWMGVSLVVPLLALAIPHGK